MSVITTEEEIYKLVELTNELRVKLEIEKKAEQYAAPVSFKDTGELASALISGRTFLTPNDLILSCDVTREGSPFICTSSSDYYITTMDTTWDYFKDLREIPSEFSPKPTPWYIEENFCPVECYVSDTNSNPGHGSPVTIITSYRPDSGHPFLIIGGGVSFKYATPTGN
jgi:hypothetical protein